MKINKCSSNVKYHFKMESKNRNFNYIAFADRFGILLDKITGIYPMSFNDPRLVFHSLKLSYALYLTMKMFKVSDIKTSQRHRNGRIFLEEKNILSSIFLNVFSQLSELRLPEKKIIKCIKNSLCYFVSKSMNQTELPQGDRISLFSAEMQKRLCERLDPKDLVRFSFSCLQSKVLCEIVPDDFILDALIKHREQLSSPHKGISPETINHLKSRGRAFGKLVVKFYNPNKGMFPTNKATFAFPRNSGGVKGDLVYHDRLRDNLHQEDPDDRMEPFVIGLFGQPGMGKSTQINKIVSELSILFPGTPLKDLVYQRTCHVDHWDGYCGQPIVVFDDLGQTMDGHDIQEFQTLVSCCPYVVPMADLSEKGQKFCSPIIICTSNLVFGMPLHQVYKPVAPVIDDSSFWRRFHVPLYTEFGKTYALLEQPSWIRDNNLIMSKTWAVDQSQRFDYTRFFGSEPDFKKGVQNKWDFQPLTSYSFLRTVFNDRRLHHNNFCQTWKQVVIDQCEDTSVLDPLLKELEGFGFTESFSFSEGNGSNKGLEFPAYPPPGPLPVRVEPICEPLKVRTITAGKGDTFCLKPFQRAMWLALGEEKQFCLTHGTNKLDTAIKRIYAQSDSDDVWISGDYSAATDSFAIEASKALLEGILESIDHEPTRRWAMKEISPHILTYPKSSGLEPVLQKSGQLMGSLLSFPLLCLLNDCTAKYSGLTSDQYLINGDDILMRANPSVYPVWKGKADEFGLELSAGKNYIDPDFGTVNSQLIWRDTVTNTGKQMVLDRRVRVLGECLRDLEIAMSDSPSEEVQDLFVSVNRKKLSLTVRSVSVPSSHGGLALTWGKPLVSKKSIRTAQLCYLHDLFKIVKPKKGYITIPYLSYEEKTASENIKLEKSFNEPVTSVEYHEDFLGPKDLSEITKRCMTHGDLRELLLNQPLESLPSLTFLKTYEIPCTDEKVRVEMQKQIDHVFLKNFLQGGQEFGYDAYKEEIERKCKDLKKTNTKDTLKHIVSLMDLDIPQDFLRYINLDYRPNSFEKEEFIRMLQGNDKKPCNNLGKILSPKEFDLPNEYPDFEDFSLDVIVEQFNAWNDNPNLILI